MIECGLVVLLLNAFESQLDVFNGGHRPPAPCRMTLCTSVTEGEVARAKNLLKTNMLLHLDGR